MLCHLGSPEVLSLDFDVVNAPVEQLYFSFVHCNADWSISELMEMEFVDGFNKVYGADVAKNSFNTTVDYVHYHLDVPTSTLLISGNFFLEVRAVQSDDLLLRLPIWMTEDACGIQSRVVRTEGTQSLEFAVVWPNHAISNPEGEMRVSLWQNKRTDDLRSPSMPTFVRPDEIVYLSSAETSFSPGREWRWLDTRSIKYVSMANAKISFHVPFYHYAFEPDFPAKGYTLRDDFNGGQWYENKERPIEDPEVAADYVVAHLTFVPSDPSLLLTHDFYVIGDAAGWGAAPSNRLEPDHDAGCVNGQVLHKQGLHNYLYVARPKGSATQAPQFDMAEGNFEETENDYFIAVYLRRPGQTYDHLVAFKTHNTLKTPDAFID